MRGGGVAGEGIEGSDSVESPGEVDSGGGGGGGSSMGGASGAGWPREAPALLSTALLLGGAMPERPPAPLFTIDSILAPRPQPTIPPLQLHHLAHTPFHRAHDLFGTSTELLFMAGENYLSFFYLCLLWKNNYY